MTTTRHNRSAFDLQGHRGARGLLPENSIPAFLLAFDLGVTTLEMDTVINADGDVVVSHDPWMTATICTHPDGRAVLESEQTGLRIYAMSGAQMAGFDCGKRGHPDFPQQRPVPVTKPLLRDVFAAVGSHAAKAGRQRLNRPMRYNIEIKSRPEHDDRFHPRVERFASLLYAVVNEFGQVGNTTIQSFDPRALEAVHLIDPQISTSLIVDNADGLQSNLARLSFTPAIYSPHFALLDRPQIDAAHALGIRVIPWTVNAENDMRNLIGLGVDGLITDYPDVGLRVLGGI